jgi:hypothetical protein
MTQESDYFNSVYRDESPFRITVKEFVTNFGAYRTGYRWRLPRYNQPTYIRMFSIYADGIKVNYQPFEMIDCTTWTDRLGWNDEVIMEPY